MLSLLHFQPPLLLQLLPIPTSKLFPNFRPYPSNNTNPQFPNFIARAETSRNPRPLENLQRVETELIPDVEEGDDNEEEGPEEGFSHASAYRGREDEKHYDRDPEFAEILGSCFDDPQKAQSKVEERIRRKRHKILHTRTGSSTAIKVIFNKANGVLKPLYDAFYFYVAGDTHENPTFLGFRYTSKYSGSSEQTRRMLKMLKALYQHRSLPLMFNFSNSYIWFEFYNAPLPKDVKLICDAIRSWHIIGRLGGCNSMNMQLSQSPLDSKRPKYDAIQGANVTPTTFYNIGDLEVQDNLARIWVDIGTSEPLLLDVLINAVTCISSDYVGIKQLVFGGSEFENWKENLTSEDAAYSSHKI